MRYLYQAEKFAAARRALMLPHPMGEAVSIAGAFHECSLGLHKIDRSQLDSTAIEWLKKLDKLMDYSGSNDSTGKGLWQVKAETLTVDQKSELSHIIDELAHWFDG